MRVSQYKCSLALGKIYRLNVSECIQVRFREGFFENRATFSHNLKPGGIDGKIKPARVLRLLTVLM